MSTSKKLIDNQFAKTLILVNGLVPAALLLWDAFHGGLGVNEVNFAIRTTGLIGLVLITLSLLITPLRHITGWNQLIAIRRRLGVLGFSYILAHFIIFVVWDRDGSIRSTIEEIIEREYLWFGFGALLLMTPLAITSTDGMVSRLGAKKWKLLHRLAYLVGSGGVVHYYLLVKSDTRPPLVFAAVVGASYLWRVGAHYVDLRKELAGTHQKLLAAKSAAPKQKPFWSGELVLARIFDETHDVKTFRFVNPDGGKLPFEHISGQYLNLKLNIDGKRVNRSYTIASSPTRQHYCEISVKRAQLASKWIHENWREGMRIQIGAPSGKFFFAGHESERVVLIAGGVGITPMMSITRSLTDRGWKGDIYLVFSVRKKQDVIFAEELRYLKARYPNLHVVLTLSNDPDVEWDGERGQITRELLEKHIPNFKRGPVLLCGPDPMMTAMRKLLVGMGIPDAEIHQEAFLAPPPMSLEEAAAAEAVEVADTATINFAKSGKTAEATRDQTVLEIAEENGIAIPFECRSGICGQCKTKLVSGKVAMDTQDALSPNDRAKGLILACQARCAKDIVLDA
ncbi:MAG: ferric reductase-like transmembrane domain-containing protein [Deltaproteobacteria bacterium]|nr:ferric reductase-like transmembrane domain-containing protein [Deltaproteobacteria bacterium]